MATLIDLLPVIVFFATYHFTGDMVLATGAILIATTLMVGVTWIHKKEIHKLHLVSAGLLAVFGGLTLLLGDGQYIMWKPSLLYWLLALVLVVASFKGHNLTQKSLVATLSKASSESEQTRIEEIPARLWAQLNLTVIGFLVALGALNLFIVLNIPTGLFSESDWVNFKLFGLTILTFVCLIYIIARISPYLSDKE